MVDAPKKGADLLGEPSSEVTQEEARLHPLLSNEEFLAAQAKARTRLDAERKKAALKSVEETELERLREETGVVENGPLYEKVDITIDIPEFAPNLTVNGEAYWPGHTYKVARHVANSLREMIARAWHHEDLEIKGKKMGEAYRRAHQTTISGRSGVSSAPGVH